MHYRLAILVHSWFSWVTARSIAAKLDPEGKQTIYIFSRGFDPKQKLPTESKAINFNKYELLCLKLGNPKTEKDTLLALDLNKSDRVMELVIPHLGYKPFVCLAEDQRFASISFYQESLQLPDGTLCEREAMLLNDKTINTTLFTTTHNPLKVKLTKKYYNMNEHFIPLHLDSVKVGDSLKNLNIYIPPCETENERLYDYAILAGKSMNTSDGIQLITNIVECISAYIPEASILFKASPSTSAEVNKHVNNLSKKNSMLYHMSGGESIEPYLINNKIQNVITEMFSLAGIFILAQNDISRIISIEATIISDYPSLTNALTERVSLNRYKKFALTFASLSHHLMLLLAIS